MYHHSESDYQTAKSEAATKARDKFEQIIDAGRETAIRVVQQVESQIPTDRIAAACALKVRLGTDGAFLLDIPGAGKQHIHEHALAQIVEKAGPKTKEVNSNRFKGYMDYLRTQKGWGPELATRNLNDMLQFSDSRHLVRSVGDTEVRGFLSDRFRRLDARPLLDAFMGACKRLGMIPLEGYALDTKVRMRVALPCIFEPIPNEVLLAGLEWGNSDFGDGGHRVSQFIMRVWCTNGATTEELMRQVHLGKRLEDNITYSKRTYQLDTAANASALDDIVSASLDAERINGYMTMIAEAAKETIGERDIDRLLKRLTKSEAEKVVGLYNGPDVYNLPAGNTAYRLSNAVSFFAQAEGISQHRRLALQEVAGSMLPQIGDKAVEV